jgi:hypothetical protein
MESRFHSLLNAFIQTPPLWTREQFGIKQFEFPDIVLSKTEDIGLPGNLRLGHKMELLFYSALKGQDKYDLIARNVVIQRGKVTLGELDFLLQDLENDGILHLELAYKFYLIDPQISEPIYRLVGPNRRDMFYTKLEKLKEQQFSIPFSAEGIAHLAARRIEALSLRQQCCFKAQLFTPFEDSRINIRPLNMDCIKGNWLRFEQLKSPSFRAYEYFLPMKEEWILTPYNTVNWISYYELLLEVNIRMLKQSSTMVWIKKGKDVFGKFFVVWW